LVSSAIFFVLLEFVQAFYDKLVNKALKGFARPNGLTVKLYKFFSIHAGLNIGHSVYSIPASLCELWFISELIGPL
jgi:hypothetical protein